MRALELLLGAVRPGDEVLTLGGVGSTHVLATAYFAARLGARTTAVRWPHDMSPVAHAVAAAAAAHCLRVVTLPNPVLGVAYAYARRWRRRTHFVPIGGSAPLGILGHVAAALELAEQIAAAALPAPARVVLPLGSGGTAAGLALGFAIAGLPTTVVGARVGPRLLVTRGRVLGLARSTAALLRRLAGSEASVPRGVAADRVEVVHDVYGGAYGRPFPAGEELARAWRAAGGPRLDSTYSAKALAAALLAAHARPGPTLFWLTFDGRWMAEPDADAPDQPTAESPRDGR